jgi:CubicO group peptidase (beta-lactamase class C family)
MRVMRLIVLVLAFAVVVRAQPVAVNPDSLGVPELLAQFKVPAVSVAVIRDFKIEWAKAWGPKDAATGEPATADTMFQAASISKPVAAMASLRAVQDGRFTLDQDINTILKVVAAAGASGLARRDRHAAHAHEPHVGHRRWLWVPGLRARARSCRRFIQMLDGLPPTNRGPVRVGRPPMTGYKYSGGAVSIPGARAHRRDRQAVPDHHARHGARPIRHDQQHLRAATP